MVKKTSSEATASAEAKRTYRAYDEPLSDARTKLKVFLTILSEECPCSAAP